MKYCFTSICILMNLAHSSYMTVCLLPEIQVWSGGLQTWHQKWNDTDCGVGKSNPKMQTMQTEYFFYSCFCFNFCLAYNFWFWSQISVWLYIGVFVICTSPTSSVCDCWHVIDSKETPSLVQNMLKYWSYFKK